MNEVLKQLYEATKSAQGYGLFKSELLAQVEDKTLIETDNAIGGPNGVAARLSAKGVMHAEKLMESGIMNRQTFQPFESSSVGPWATKQEKQLDLLDVPVPHVPNLSPISEAFEQAHNVPMEEETTLGLPFTQPIPNIPVPPLGARAGREKKEDPYGFGKLKINDSFFVQCDADGFKKLASVVSNRKRLLTPKTFVIRRVEDGKDWGKIGQSGAGIWRVEDASESRQSTAGVVD